MAAKTVISPGGTRRSHSSGGASLQRVTAPLAVFTVKQRRAGGAADAGSSAGGGGADDGAAAAGDCDLVLAGGGLYAGVVLTWSFTSPASFSPRSLHFFPE